MVTDLTILADVLAILLMGLANGPAVYACRLSAVALRLQRAIMDGRHDVFFLFFL